MIPAKVATYLALTADAAGLTWEDGASQLTRDGEVLVELEMTDTGTLIARRVGATGPEASRAFARRLDARHRFEEVRSAQDSEAARLFSSEELAGELAAWAAVRTGA